MLTLVTGAPGTGKTAAIVDMLQTIGKDRPLFVFGLDGLSIDHVPLADPAKWMELVPDGAVIIIDEVQQVWRPRGPGVKVPDHVAALETHRHRGLDFYLTTQGPNLLDANVRALVGRHIHLRELGVLGRMWYEWPECADNCRVAFRNAPIKKRYRLPKRVFADYKSASIHVKPIRSFPMALVVAVVAIAVVAYLAWGFYVRLTANIAGGTKPATAQVGPQAHAPSTAPMGRLLTQAGATPAAPISPASAASPAVPVAPVGPAALGGPPAVSFAGCAVVRGVCKCYDTAGQDHAPMPGSCGRASGVGQPVLAYADVSDLPPRPSADREADYAMLRAYSPRSLPWIR